MATDRLGESEALLVDHSRLRGVFACRSDLDVFGKGPKSEVILDVLGRGQVLGFDGAAVEFRARHFQKSSLLTGRITGSRKGTPKNNLIWNFDSLFLVFFVFAVRLALG